MDIFQTISDVFSSVSKDGINKAKEVRDTAKLSFDIREHQTMVQKFYRELGKAYYNDHKDDEDCPYDQIEKITKALEAIEDLRKQKSAMKEERVCPNCSTKVDGTASYCPNCGAELPIVDVEEDDFCEEEIEVLTGDVVDNPKE